jgi:hypothetical protein
LFPTLIPEATPPAPVPSEQDPSVRAAVQADFRSGPREVERKVRGMGYDRGRQFRRTSADALVTRLAAKYGVAEDQVRRMIGR